MSIFYPEQYAESAKKVDYQKLRGQHVRALLFDVDNTLATYNTALPDAGVRNFVQELKGMGFQVILVSNGGEKRVSRFAAVLDVPYIFRAMKPLPTGIRRALEKLECRPDQAAIVGDQVFTDVWGGNWAGVHTVLTRPISDEDDEWITRIKRGLERRVVQRYLKKVAGEHE